MACAFTGVSARDGGKKDADLVALLLRELCFLDDLLLLDQDDPRRRRVVRRVLTRHPDMARGRDLDRALQHRFEVLAGHSAGPEDGRGLACDVDDGRLDADAAGTAVQDEVDGIAELRPDVVSRGGADRAEAVGGRGGDTSAEGREQREGDGMVGHAHGHRLQATRGFQGHPAAAPQDQRERPWPEVLGQQARRLGHVLDPVAQMLCAADMDDQRVGRWTSLDLEDARDGSGILGVGAQSVDSQNLAGAQMPRASSSARTTRSTPPGPVSRALSPLLVRNPHSAMKARGLPASTAFRVP